MDTPKKLYLEFSPSEAHVYRAVAEIFAGYIAAGQVNQANEKEMMRKAVSHALLLAEFVDEVVVSDDESDPAEQI